MMTVGTFKDLLIVLDRLVQIVVLNYLTMVERFLINLNYFGEVFDHNNWELIKVKIKS